MAKIKVYVDKYGSYPVYSLYDFTEILLSQEYYKDYTIEVEEDFYRKYLVVVEAYKEMQQSLEKLYTP